MLLLTSSTLQRLILEIQNGKSTIISLKIIKYLICHLALSRNMQREFSTAKKLLYSLLCGVLRVVLMVIKMAVMLTVEEVCIVNLLLLILMIKPFANKLMENVNQCLREKDTLIAYSQCLNLISMRLWVTLGWIKQLLLINELCLALFFNLTIFFHMMKSNKKRANFVLIKA